MIFIALSPITARRHGVIRRKLEAMEARSKQENAKNQILDKGATQARLTFRGDQAEVTTAFK